MKLHRTGMSVLSALFRDGALSQVSDDGKVIGSSCAVFMIIQIHAPNTIACISPVIARIGFGPGIACENGGSTQSTINQTTNS